MGLLIEGLLTLSRSTRGMLQQDRVDLIGLATVHRIVHRHGDTIRAAAAVGKGATFSFSLPYAEKR